LSGAPARSIIPPRTLPIILGAHIILSTYGFWLPNDPRGSWSDYVGKPELFNLGRATKVQTAKSVAHVPHDAHARRAAKKLLEYPPVRFTGRQALAIAEGFRQAIREGDYIIHACCILPTHVHLAIGPHERKYHMIALHLKNRATSVLRQRGLDPMQALTPPGEAPPSPWAKGLWKVYIRDAEHLRAVIRYVEENPLREGKKIQRWSFVSPLNAAHEAAPDKQTGQSKEWTGKP